MKYLSSKVEYNISVCINNYLNFKLNLNIDLEIHVSGPRYNKYFVHNNVKIFPILSATIICCLVECVFFVKRNACGNLLINI